jgi:hypothetical protein
MKQNTFAIILAAGAVCSLVSGITLAQQSGGTTTTEMASGADVGTTTSTSTGGADVGTTTSTTTMDGTGTITAVSPGSDFITFRTETSTEPVKYYFSKQTTVVDSEGDSVDMSMLQPDMPVRYTYTKDGDRMVISKVTLEKPISYYKKDTTTTTTTSP